MSSVCEPIVIEYDDLIEGLSHASPSPQTYPCAGSDDKEAKQLIRKKLSRAFATMGIVAIRNVPGFVEAKKRMLLMAQSLVNLPTDYLESELSHSESLYNSGWARGKEKLGKAVDENKASYFFNPYTDTAGTEELRIRYPTSYPPNKWPGEAVLPGFKNTAKSLGGMVRNVVLHVCRYIDEQAGIQLHEALSSSDKVKARLLYYYPVDESKKNTSSDADWIGWHCDSGFLTGLVGDMYIDHVTGEEIQREDVDPSSGLFIAVPDQNDGEESLKTSRVNIPFDCMAVQIGECVQIMTDGKLRATPHCVKSGKSHTRDNVARVSLPIFIDTAPDYVMTCEDREAVLRSSVPHPGVPLLGERWLDEGGGQTYGDFLKKSIQMYYGWSDGEK